MKTLKILKFRVKRILFKSRFYLHGSPVCDLKWIYKMEYESKTIPQEPHSLFEKGSPLLSTLESLLMLEPARLLSNSHFSSTFKITSAHFCKDNFFLDCVDLVFKITKIWYQILPRSCLLDRHLYAYKKAKHFKL